MKSQNSRLIQISVQCKELKKMDNFSHSDPYVILYVKQNYTGTYENKGKTQTIEDQPNPSFKKSFQLQYLFSINQQIKFQVYDDDNGKDQLIGQCETTIPRLMASNQITKTFQLKYKDQVTGKILVVCQQYLNEKDDDVATFKFRGVNLMNTDSGIFGNKTDAYLKFIKHNASDQTFQVIRTNAIQDDLNPNWDPVTISLSKLINTTWKKFRIECWDYQKKQKDHKLIGYCNVFLEDIQKATKQKIEFQLNHFKNKKPGYIVLESCQIIKNKKTSFIDYLKGGMNLNMIVAIDFTASNGPYDSYGSLHYLDPIDNSKLTQYQMIIMSLSQIILQYEKDNTIPCFGFGAKFNDKVSDCFPLIGSNNELTVNGLDELLLTYRNTLKQVQLYGPTNFAKVLSQSMKIAQRYKASQSKDYQILIILSDGQIFDMDQTIKLLLQATQLPLSVIIIGIGNQSFQKMHVLDGDKELVDKNNVKAARDIVQFVQFNKFNKDSKRLAEQILAQIPNQILQYKQLTNIKP